MTPKAMSPSEDADAPLASSTSLLASTKATFFQLAFVFKTFGHA
jgi:hypothetical protein